MHWLLSWNKIILRWDYEICSYIITIVIKFESGLAQMIMHSNVFSRWMIRYMSLITFTLKPIKVCLDSIIKSNYYKTYYKVKSYLYIKKNECQKNMK